MGIRIRMRFTGAWLCLMVVVLAAMPAHAHKIMVFGYLDDGKVRLEGYFADGKKAENSLVEVFGPDGSKLLEGRTDTQGVFAFPMPDVPQVKIVLTGSMGHRAECTVEGERKAPVRQSVPAKPAAVSKSMSGDDAYTRARTAKVAERTGAAQAERLRENAVAPCATELTEERVRTIVAQELDRKLGPLRREVALLTQHKTSLTDILGGIGYIAGIMGLLMYFKARRGGGV